MSRDYAQVRPSFWTGDTARRLRRHPHAQALACYLMTCPQATALGLYRLPIPYVVHDLGWAESDVRSALELLCDDGFALYDPEREWIWVRNLARENIGPLKPADNRVRWVRDELHALRGCPFVAVFAEYYAEAFHLGSERFATAPARSSKGPLAPPSKPLRSQEQDQEQDQEQEIHKHAGAQVGEREGAESGVRSVAAVQAAVEAVVVRDAAPPELEDGEPAPEDADRMRSGALVWRRYVARMVERTGLRPSEAPRAVQAAATLGAWLDDQVRDARELEARLGRLLEHFFADPWAEREGWPLAALAGNPHKFLRAAEARPLAPVRGEPARRLAVSLEHNPHAQAPSVAEQMRKLRAGGAR